MEEGEAKNLHRKHSKMKLLCSAAAFSSETLAFLSSQRDQIAAKKRVSQILRWE